MALTDNSPMPFGKYKDQAMSNVPASYLLWLYDTGIQKGDVRDYIEDNLDALRLEVKSSIKNRDLDQDRDNGRFDFE